MSSQSHFTRTLVAIVGGARHEHGRGRRRRRPGAGLANPSTQVTLNA